LSKYGKPVWQYVLEAAKEIQLKTFAPTDIIRKVQERNPSIPAVTIRSYVIAMAPNHPSSKHYPSTRRLHGVFTYLGDGLFRLLNEKIRPETESVKQEPFDRGLKVAEWEKLREKIVGLQSDIAPFKVDFLDRDSFKRFCDNLDEIQEFNEICVTGYFSETIRGSLEKIIKIGRHVRLICPEFSLGSKRDRRNMEALKKLAGAGVEIKFNSRLHARLLVAFNAPAPQIRGLLILGSFDFNTECIGKERYDAGIRTTHPDLILSAIRLFEQVWKDSESTTIAEFVVEKKR
jgi:hypothetical protein